MRRVASIGKARTILANKHRGIRDAVDSESSTYEQMRDLHKKLLNVNETYAVTTPEPDGTVVQRRQRLL